MRDYFHDVHLAAHWHASTPAQAELTHPFWVFAWDEVLRPEVCLCSVILFFSGILCSAAGIGGGGIYVAVLMLVGRLSPHNAVPLSKAIVFVGAIASLFVNLSRSLQSCGATVPKQVIDIDACRLMIPATLIGTFIGVLLNRHTSDNLIVLLLTALLGMMTGMVAQQAKTQALEEKTESSSGTDAMACESSTTVAVDEKGECIPLLHDAIGEVEEASACALPSRLKDAASAKDASLSGILLAFVVFGSILRFHMHACQAEVGGDASSKGACQHPVNLIFHHRMENWMKQDRTAAVLQQLVWTLPILACVAISVHYGHVAHERSGWPARRILLYQLVAVMTGLLAGLVGVGGGLIFSPFFLLAGMNPAVAVGTSATCVLFTSASTTMQYIFTDRVIMSLAFAYGLVTCVASYCGTCLVHVIQDRFARKSYITSIVALGVGISAILTVIKFIYMVSHENDGTIA